MHTHTQTATLSENAPYEIALNFPAINRHNCMPFYSCNQSRRLDRKAMMWWASGAEQKANYTTIKPFSNATNQRFKSADTQIETYSCLVIGSHALEGREKGF